jgi:hypothetical protein
MSTVPYTFAGVTGNIPLVQLDQNFANVKLSVDFVIQPNQSNITSLGTLTGLSVNGNVLANAVLSVAGNTTLTSNVFVGNNMVVSGNVSVSGNVDITGNTTHGNIFTAGIISAGGNIFTAGFITAGGNIITSGNISTAGLLTAAGNIQAGNLRTAGLISAAGNLFANNVSVADINASDISLTGNIIIDGNASVSGTTTFINTQNLNITDKNIVIANGVSTSALIDGAGIDAGVPTVAYIRYTDASKGWTTANNLSVGGNLTVTGRAFATTPANGTSNTQVATTLFVDNTVTAAIDLLGTMSIQNANNVSIEGGTITGITDLAVADGGTGRSTLTLNNVLTGNGTGAINSVAPGTSGNVLTSNGSAWTSTCQVIGVNQTWTDVSGSRSVGVTYTNSTGRPILVLVTLVNTGGAWMYINGNLVIRQFYDVNTGAGQVGYSFVTAIIPNGATYLVTSGNLSTWWELT